MSKLPENPVLDFLEERGVETCMYEAFPVGSTMYFRMAVYSVVGLIVGYCGNGKFLVLDNAYYVATDGRYGEAVRSGFPESAELEFAGDGMRLNVEFINDAVEYRHELPKDD